MKGWVCAERYVDGKLEMIKPQNVFDICFLCFYFKSSTSSQNTGKEMDRPTKQCLTINNEKLKKAIMLIDLISIYHRKTCLSNQLVAHVLVTHPMAQCIP